MNFLFLYSENSQIGLGHKKRIEALIEVFEADKHKTNSFNIENSFNPTSPSINSLDAIIIDTPINDLKSRIPSYVNSMIPIIALDYFGDCDVDLMLSAFNHYPERVYKNAVFDSKFFIIRSEILKSKNGTSSNGFPLIMPGGGDALGLSNKMIALASKLTEDFLFIQGPLQSNPPRISQSKILKNPTNLPHLMANCPFAITNGGGSMIEMVYLNKPIFVFPQSDFEKHLANHFLDLGLIYDITKKPTKDIHGIFAFKPRPNTIDGKGTKHLYKRIIDFLRV